MIGSGQSASLRDYLVRTVSADIEILLDDGVWVVSLRGRPFAVEATAYDRALTEMVELLLEYAEDWQDNLLAASNHAGNAALVQLITLSTDSQVHDWLVGAQGG